MLLGLYGAAGCGKDTLANEILNYDSYERYRFADPLKNMLRQFHIPDNTWEDREAKVYHGLVCHRDTWHRRLEPNGGGS
jgi:hypothetical protein